MKAAIRIEGGLLAPDLLERLEDHAGQRAADFGLDAAARVKDEIARAWVEAQDLWRRFGHRLATLPPHDPATTETREHWVLPLLGVLGWGLAYQARAQSVDGRAYPISHRVHDRGGMPVHVLGLRDPAGLDRRPAPRPAVPRMSAHALVQEYLNRSDTLYGAVTNGALLRLLRDSAGRVRPAYLEFDLECIFGEGRYGDFALLYRLLHISRLPAGPAPCWLERYHQDALEAGARIRAGLSRAVEQAITALADGFIRHPDNWPLRRQLQGGSAAAAAAFYTRLLRLIYRLLFLMVIEERGLIFPPQADPRHRDIYTRYYSLERLRRLSGRRELAQRRHADLWPALQSTFSLFEAGGPGAGLGLAALDGELFHPRALGELAACALDNEALLVALHSLDSYAHPDSGHRIRVNYAALSVEEFGAVYEELLEYAPVVVLDGARGSFEFSRGSERARTGSHYTPDELVQPLLRHTLDPLVAQCLQGRDPAAALLALRVLDPACGSGHILLAAARRIAGALAAVRTGEEPPSPLAFRTALREVVRHCIHGVDLNPLAVELCRVALWLEAHVPGEPLSFLDHHIRCGNAIVGHLRREDVAACGVPDEAFACQLGDDREAAAALRRRNRAQRAGQRELRFDAAMEAQLVAAASAWRELSELPDHTPAQVEAIRRRFIELTRSPAARWLGSLADVAIAQFYLPKRADGPAQHVTQAAFDDALRGLGALDGSAAQAAAAVAARKRFLHWFLAFPEVMAAGGFDCVLGNPPYLGGSQLSGRYGHAFCSYVRWAFAPTGLSDLVVFFLRRMHALLRSGGYAGLVTTNSIRDGDLRRDGLEQVLADGSEINYAERAVRWPGRAHIVVSLLAFRRAARAPHKLLDGQPVERITAFLDDERNDRPPAALAANAQLMFEGVKQGGEGFLVSAAAGAQLCAADPASAQVLFPCLNGQEINRRPDQRPQRMIINFGGREERDARRFAAPFAIVEARVKPVRAGDKRAAYRERWWQYAERRPGLAARLRSLDRVFVAAVTTKYLNFSAARADAVFLNTLDVLACDRWDLYAVVQSSLHEAWARRYSGTLKQDLRYSPSKCFGTYAFPADLLRVPQPVLTAVGERYHELRRGLMRRLWIGLTDLYNLFHDPGLDPVRVARASGQGADVAAAGHAGLLELRRLHAALDTAVRDAYGWSDLPLAHGFVEVDTLPEHDRTRFTIAPAARRELLQRLLALNHERAQPAPWGRGGGADLSPPP